MQLPPPNYDETQVPSYTLPELLRCQDGTEITSADAWRARRRPELLELFRRYVYGRFDARCDIHIRTVVSDAPMCGGLARRTELDVLLVGREVQPRTQVILRLLILRPSSATSPCPVFLGLNLFGNQVVHPDPNIRLAEGWLPENPDLGLVGHQATESSRGMHAGRFAIEMLVSRGYAVATAYSGDIDPDFDDALNNGVHAFLSREAKARPDAPGTISAWAFGLSRILDAIETRPELDGERVVVFGHSRLGKAALWAAAQDERFAMAISNESGCGGAALSRRRYGERLIHINERFPHWFCRAFHAFNEREHELPVDQHQLLALVAPRPLYVASATADSWADPEGERLACLAAAPCYQLHGSNGLRPGNTTNAHIGYHVRPGRHDITARDLWHYLAFADEHLKDDDTRNRLESEANRTVLNAAPRP
jgi:hypothetical protein